MRCYICNAIIEEPQFNADHKDYEPCEHCLLIVEDTLASYEDRPSAGEDDLGFDPFFEGLAKPLKYHDDDV